MRSYGLPMERGNKMSHAQKTAQEHARWSVTSHNPRSFMTKTEDTTPERILRRILEELSREMDGLSFKSQDGRYDFWLQGVPIDVQTSLHEKQKRRDHDAFKASKVIELGYPSPLFLTEKQLKHSRPHVKELLRYLALTQGGCTEKLVEGVEYRLKHDPPLDKPKEAT